MADRVVEVIKAKYLASPIKFEGMNRTETLEVPIEALREILYNSIAHKDYTGPDTQMRVFDDHVEIWNEGVLPEGYDENVLYGKHSSKPRNRNIADVMFKAGFIDTWGRGYSKIREGFKKTGLPIPSVKSDCGGTLVTFKRGYDVASGKRVAVSDDVSNGVSLAGLQLSDRQKNICKLIQKDSFVSSKRMSEVLSVAHRTIQRDLASMKKMGILVREGKTSAGHWIICTS